MVDIKKGSSIKTGLPITINYNKNPIKAPNLGKRFGQDVEPDGKYVTQNEGYAPEGWKQGAVHFKNPLVIDGDCIFSWV